MATTKTAPSLRVPTQLYETLFTMPRTIVFRGATFAALKGYINEHRKRTGVVLNNTAAIDMILQQHLKAYILADVK